MHLLIIEDNKRIAKSLERGLAESGYETQTANCGESALLMLEENAVDLAILDLGLPDIDGMDLLPQLRNKNPKLPVIILTARSEIEDRVAGLDAGADDYLVKPFAFSELVARIRALVRRGAGQSTDQIQVEDLTLNPIQRTAQRDETSLDLTHREFDLLLFLAQHHGESVSREMIAREVWNITSRAIPFDNIMDVHISNLRKKIDADFDLKLIHTVRGIGFTLKGADS
jgi:two-component system copper resistance phosphate regulon response regulator CusR